jgi:guanyl-specific ribonuclease Sa
MKTSPLDREIRSRIDTLLSDISQLVKSSALEAVSSALGGSSMASAAPARAAAAPRRRGRPGKRSSEDVQASADALLAYIKKNEGQRLEQIAKGMGMSSKELKLPVQKLFAAKAIKTKGKKRGTMYFAK